MSFYALRYRDDVPLDRRKHAPTVGRWEDFVDAENERQKRFNGELLEVVVRFNRGEQ